MIYDCSKGKTMPRQIHVTITPEQRERCLALAQRSGAEKPWQEICRILIDAGYETVSITLDRQAGKKGGK